MAKIPSVIKWFLGLGATATLSSDSVAQMITNAKRVGSAGWLSGTQPAKGKMYYINNGKRILLQVKGTLNGIKGIFEYIIDENGNVRHQFFKAEGVINGRPN